MMMRIGIRSIIRGNIIGVFFFSMGALLYIMGVYEDVIDWYAVRS